MSPRQICIKTLLKSIEILLRIRSFILCGAKGIWSQYSLLAQNFAPLDINLDNLSTGAAKKILIVIPFKDKWEVTKKCLQSLLLQKIYNNQITVVLVSNNSADPDTEKNAQKWLVDNKNVRGIAWKLHTDNSKFNFSKLNNDAVKLYSDATYSYILFLNNDTEFIKQDTLARMTQAFASDIKVGIVGTTLLYPDFRIQHLFAAPSVKIIAAHPGKYLKYTESAKWFASEIRKVPAVTGAALLIKRELFYKIGLFDENLPTTGQDIDLCLQATAQKYTNVVLTKDPILHHETITRSHKLNIKEISYFYDKWEKTAHLQNAWPSTLSQWSEKPTLRWFEPNYPWKFSL